MLGRTRPRLAELLALLVPGSGHAYAGRLRRGVVWYVTLILLDDLLEDGLIEPI